MRLDEVAATESIGQVCELASVPNASFARIRKIAGRTFPDFRGAHDRFLCGHDDDDDEPNHSSSSPPPRPPSPPPR
jgi:hypothetical protein